MEKKYQIELTETQLQLIADCVDDCHRFLGGQTELFHTTSRLENYLDIKHELQKLRPLVVQGVPYDYGWNGGGCPNDEQRKRIAQTYPIYREILHFFALEKNLDNTYTSPTLTCEEGGNPIKIKRIE